VYKRQDLVRAVARANLNTVVVVNAGSPVDMPWRDDVAAILVCWFGGQELGPALSNVLVGNAEPSGRLATTWNMSDEAEPLSTTPVSGKLHYSEGLNIGYRRASRSVTFPFGAGLGYGNWSLLKASATVEQGFVKVQAELLNSGQRPSKGFCQVFAAKPDSRFMRPSRWLVGWARTNPAIGVQELEISIPLDCFETYFNGWHFEPGGYQLEVALNAGDPGVVIEIQI
jgi:beta-glucosidase